MGLFLIWHDIRTSQYPYHNNEPPTDALCVTNECKMKMANYCTVKTKVSHIPQSLPWQLHQPSVAANHENDTCFWNGLVMGLADCVN